MYNIISSWLAMELFSFEGHFLLSDREKCIFHLQILSSFVYAKNLAGWWEHDAERRWWEVHNINLCLLQKPPPRQAGWRLLSQDGGWSAKADVAKSASTGMQTSQSKAETPVSFYYRRSRCSQILFELHWVRKNGHQWKDFSLLLLDLKN